MKYVKWIFVVLLIGSLTSFVEKDKPTGGLNVGDIAPDFKIQSMSDEQHELSNLKGKYVLLSFWASYDASSRAQNAALSHLLKNQDQVKMISISFDRYRSVFNAAVRQDQIDTASCHLEMEGENSKIFKSYGLESGFRNFLLNSEGVIVAKIVSASELGSYLN